MLDPCRQVTGTFRYRPESVCPKFTVERCDGKDVDLPKWAVAFRLTVLKLTPGFHLTFY
jgi:hypothetical protein